MQRRPQCRAAGVHAIGNMQQWLIGIYQGVSKAQLQVYLDDSVLRHNRRRQPMAAFQTLLGLGTERPTTRLVTFLAQVVLNLPQEVPGYCRICLNHTRRETYSRNLL